VSSVSPWRDSGHLERAVATTGGQEALLPEPIYPDIWIKEVWAKRADISVLRADHSQRRVTIRDRRYSGVGLCSGTLRQLPASGSGAEVCLSVRRVRVEPFEDLLGVRVGRKDRVEDVLDASVAGHDGQA
jgi:hypothetical protein